jgi:hypothetical protein
MNYGTKKKNWARCQWPTSVILGGRDWGIAVQSQPWQIVQETLSQIYPTQKRASRMAQVVECLPTKHEALRSNPNTTHIQKRCIYIGYLPQREFEAYDTLGK